MGIIHQNPSTNGSKPVIRSVNEREGLEFTWSVWLFIDDLAKPGGKWGNSRISGQRKHIFNKGSQQNFGDKRNFDGINVSDMMFPNNAPGLYIHETKNAFVIVMNTFNNVIEEVEVDNIPLNKWILVNMRNRGKYMDRFSNGTIVNRHTFRSVPKQN